MNLIRNLALPVAAAVSFAVATPASAAIPVSAAPGPGTVFSGDFSEFIGNSSLAPGAFNDFFNFTVIGGSLDGSLTATLAAPSGSAKGAVITAVTLDGIAGSWTDISTPGLSQWQLTFNPTNIGVGSHYINVIGNWTGTRGGSYGGNLNFAAVPEPGTWALMLAGFGVIGFAMRRRQNVRVSFA